MSRYSFDLARPADSDELCDLVGAPMDGTIRVAMERTGSYFHGAGVQSDSPQVIVARDASGHIVACCSVGTREVFVNGTPRPVFYIGDLRIHPSARNGTVLARGFRFLRERVMSAPDAFAQTMILQENKAALEILTSGRAGLPRYCEAGDYDCFAIRPGRSRASLAGRFEIRAATRADVPAMQTLFDRAAPAKQFFPVYRFAELETSLFHRDLRIEDFRLAWSGGERVGMTAVWNQSSFKRTRIAGYSPALSLARPAVNLFTKLSGGFRLPPPGTAPAHAHLTCIVCRDNDPEIFASLLATIRSEHAAHAYDYFLCGLDHRDPLRAAFDGLPALNYPGQHFLVRFGEDPRERITPGIFHFESGRI